MRKFLVVIALAAAVPLFAQRKQLTLEAIYDPVNRIQFSGAVQSGFEWLDDSTVIWPRTDAWGELVEWRLFDAKSGKERSLFDRGRMQKALEDAGLTADQAKSAAAQRSFRFDAKKSAVVFTAAGDLFVYSFASGTASRVTSSPAVEEEATFSPDGRRIAFVRGNDLWVTDLAGRERQLTTGGGPQRLNGKLDYVYQEEVYGRGTFRAYWWSPDSTRIAYLSLDETPVPEYTIVDHIPHRPALEVYDYPKAGDPNPRVALLVVRASGGPSVTIDTERYAGSEHLIVDVAWNGDGSALTFQLQNREQTWLDLNSADPSSGTNRTLFRETTPAWVSALGSPEWLPDGSFLWQSERSGWRHLYHYRADGTLVRQVTSGEWEVRDVHGYDPKASLIYFSGTQRSVLGSDVYRVKLDGSALQRLSAEEGTHAATLNPSKTLYVDRWSDVRTPSQARLHRADGSRLQVIEANAVPALAEYALAQPEFLQVPARDGFAMESMIIRPPDFDPAKKYPVYFYVYAGPHAQSVRNAWGGQSGLFYRLLGQSGVIVWMSDNRTASGKGAVSAWPVYKRFGEPELADIEDSVAWLAKQPYVDASKILISGWSYGGFMAAYALTHSKSFAAGIAGAPVTDWRDYDSIYTERYMQMPQNNAEGYRKSSPRFAAADLSGRLLLLHGTVDDNVHLQSTVQLAYELQKNGKLFDMMLYPKARHGVRDRAQVLHLQRTILEFVRKTLQ